MQINGNVYSKREGKENCLFGKLEWSDYSVKENGEVDIKHSRVTIIFEAKCACPER